MIAEVGYMGKGIRKDKSANVNRGEPGFCLKFDTSRNRASVHNLKI